MLPGGRGVLFTITAAGSADNADVAVLDLKTGQRKTLVRGGSQAEYVDPSGGTGPGYLIYAAAGTLRAVRFDPDRLEVLGDPVTVLEQVMIKPTGAANYAVSRAGHALLRARWRERADGAAVARVGRPERARGTDQCPAAPFGSPRISPDGTRLLLGITDQESNDIWIWDFERETLRRLTVRSWLRFTGAVDTRRPADHLHVGSRGHLEPVQPGRRRHRYRRTADDECEPAVPIVHFAGRKTRRWLRRLSIAGLDPHGARLYLASPVVSHGGPRRDAVRRTWAEFSPNGRYLAYVWAESETGQSEVYVRPFPDVDGGRWQISTTGGTRPAWARSGRELFYLDASNTLTAVPVQTSGSTFSAGKPAKVFDAKYSTPLPPRSYDVSADGERFLMLKDSAAGDPNATPASMVVVEHWFEELKQRVEGK